MSSLVRIILIMQYEVNKVILQYLIYPKPFGDIWLISVAIKFAFHHLFVQCFSELLCFPSRNESPVTPTHYGKVPTIAGK